MLKFGIIGAGGIARTMAETIREMPEVESTAIAASPLSFWLPPRSSMIAARIVTGSEIYIGATESSIATVMAPKATWDRPSPIME